MELVTVLVIISILSTISYTSYKGYHQRARVYAAKKDLSAIVAIAETFNANTGFFLPNLREMHVPIKGRYHHNYKVICHTNGNLGNVLWKTDTIASDICGDFTLTTTPDPDDSSKNTLNVSASCSNATCWMGAVLCHNYSPGTSILCGSGNDYTFNFANRGVLQLKSATDEDWDANVKNEELAPLFNIVDFAAKKDDGNSPPTQLSGDPHCKRVSRGDDVLTDASACFFIKEYAVDSGSVETIIQANWTGDEEAYISTPSKLVVTALACKESQSDCTGTTFDYSIIRMDTNRLVKIVR